LLTLKTQKRTQLSIISRRSGPSSSYYLSNFKSENCFSIYNLKVFEVFVFVPIFEIFFVLLDYSIYISRKLSELISSDPNISNLTSKFSTSSNFKLRMSPNPFYFESIFVLEVNF